MRKKRLFAAAIAAVMAMSMLAGCGQKDTTGENLVFEDATSSSGTGQTGDADSQNKNDPNGEKPTDEGYGILREANTTTIGSLNPHTYINSYSSEQIKRASVALYTYFPNEDYTFCDLSGELAAEDPIQVDEEGKVWQIKLREGVTWENGDALDADDVIYTWKMILDPKLANLRASNFAKDVIEIENAMAYFEGSCDWDAVGLKKVDSLTVEIHTVDKQSAQEIMTHLAHPANVMVNEEYYEKYMNADRTETMYGTSADKWISAGPFTVESWTNDAEIKFKKNPNYIFKDKIWLAGINVKVVEDAGTQMQLFENGETDYISLSTDNYVKYQEDPRLLTAPYNSVTHITLNTVNPDQPILANEKFRQALFFATDRDSIANLTYQEPADYIVPTTHIIDLENGTYFRDTEEGKANEYENNGYDPEKAKQLFEEALAETGIDKVTLTMIYNDTGVQVTTSEFCSRIGQRYWEKINLN